MDRTAFLDCLPFLCPSSCSLDELEQAVLSADPTNGLDHSSAGPSILPYPLAQVPAEERRLNLTQHHLSIEPLVSGVGMDAAMSLSLDEQANLHPGRVAFFEVDDTTSDPALTPCEMEFRWIVRQAIPQLPQQDRMFSQSHHNDTTTTGSEWCSQGGFRKRMHRPVPPPPPMALVTIRILNKLYFVDWTRLIRVQVSDEEDVIQAPPTTNDEQKKFSTNTEKRVTKPPCLLLYFPSCLFRIFAMDTSTDKASSTSPSTRSNFDLYRALESILVRLQTDCYAPTTIVPVLSLSDLTEPLKLLPTVSFKNEPPIVRGTADGSNRQLAGRASNESRGSSSTHTTTTTTTDPDAAAQKEALFQHQQRAHRQCREEFASLWTLLLDQPAVSILSTLSRHNNIVTDQTSPLTTTTRALLGRDIASLMTTIAQDLATSMGNSNPSSTGNKSSSTVNTVEQRRMQLEEQRLTTRQQLEQALNNFFPAPRHRKRQKVDGAAVAASAGGSTNVSAGATYVGSSSKTREQVQALLQQHKKLIREKHELLSWASR